MSDSNGRMVEKINKTFEKTGDFVRRDAEKETTPSPKNMNGNFLYNPNESLTEFARRLRNLGAGVSLLHPHTLLYIQNPVVVGSVDFNYLSRPDVAGRHPNLLPAIGTPLIKSSHGMEDPFPANELVTIRMAAGERDAILHLQELVAQKSRELAASRVVMEENRVRFEQLRAENVEMTTKIENLQKTQEAFEKLKKEKLRWHEPLVQLKGEVEELKTIIGEKNAEIENINSRIETSTKETRESLGKKEMELINKCRQVDRLIGEKAELSGRVDELTKTLTESNRMLAEKVEKNVQKTAEISKLSEESLDLTEMITQLKKDMKDLEEIIGEKDIEIAKANASNIALENSLKSCKLHNNELKAQMEKSQKEKDKETTKFAKEKEDLDRKVTELQEQVESMGKKIEEKSEGDVDTEMEETQKKFNETMDQMEKSVNESIQKSIEILKLSEEKDRLIAQLKNEVESLGEIIGKKDVELEQMTAGRAQETVRTTRKIEELQAQIMRTRERLIEKSTELKAARDLQNEIDTLQGR